METLIELDKKLFLFLNSMHHPLLDPVMFYLTQTFFWLPLYTFLIFLIFKKYEKSGWYILLGAVVTIIPADPITSSLMKPFFSRFSPSHEPRLTDTVHLVTNYLG